MKNLDQLYKDKFDSADRMIEIPFEDKGKETKLSVAVIDPRPDLDIAETSVITLGLSAFNKGKDKFELFIGIVGSFEEKQLALLVQSALKLLPADGHCYDGQLDENGGLAIFKENGISTILYANRGLTDEDYLDEDKDMIRLMEPVPLFVPELKSIAGEYINDRSTIIYQSGVVHRDPERKPEQYNLSQIAVFNAWTMILVWYKEQGVKQYDVLNDTLRLDAKAVTFDYLLEEIRADLPPSFCASLTVMNHEVHVNSYSLFDAERIKEIYDEMNEMLNDGTFNDYHENVLESDKIINKWWSPSWIPFAMNGGGDLLCIDLSPDKKGIKGQVINFFNDQGPSETEYPSYFHWLLSYKSDLQASNYRVTKSGLIEEAS
jgi:cell wall assembly regulator SMI1